MGDESSSSTSGGIVLERIAGRYQVCESLGRGGMAAVYRVVDTTNGREVALKQLQTAAQPNNQRLLEALFEQEFRTLAQLDHPRVIRVYDYGVDANGAYYTMELLDGTNLADRAPIPWREACALAHDVCSSLALLHSRGLIHRDVTPHNVRCTHDGRAKLIDFGAMTQVGANDKVVGTPAFAAPEAAHGLTLDARTDLFSLGATLYFALTGRVAYPARSFSHLGESWRIRPKPASALVTDIPTRLDALVMSLLSLEAAQRPRSASEVMQQLASLAGIDRDEQLDLTRVYLATPALVGRSDLLSKVKLRAVRATRSQTRRGSGLLLLGNPGMGRSRALDACILEAKTQGALVLRASAKSAGSSQFATAQLLAAQLHELLPELSLAAAQSTQTSALLFDSSGRLQPLAALTAGRAAVQEALERWWIEVSQERALAFAVDDLEHVDDASGACLAALADRVKQHRLLLLFSARELPEGSNRVLDVVTPRCAQFLLLPLTAAEVGQLIQSVFGDVPNVGLLADRVYRIAQGNPRACMDLAQHLVDRGTIRYDAGSWTLPATLDPDELPTTMDETFFARADALSGDARWLAEVHALSIYGGLSLEDHLKLAAIANMSALTQARSELLARGVLIGVRHIFSMANDAWVSVLTQRMSGAELAQRHHTLARLGEQLGKHELCRVHHLLRAGEAAAALDLLAEVIAVNPGTSSDPIANTPLTASGIARVFSEALSATESLQRRPREIAELQRWLCILSSICEEEHYTRVAASWLQTLRRDAGLDDWAQLPHITDPNERLTQALSRTAARYEATDPAERTYAVQDAIPHLVQYLVASISFGTRTLDASVLRSLPDLLLPLVPLSPLLDAMRQNAIASCESIVDGRLFQARDRWLQVYDHLGKVQTDALRYVDDIRAAVAFGVGSLEAARGIASAEHWAEVLEQGSTRKVDAVYLRKIIALQHGDLDASERFRRKAELLAVRTGVRPLFSSTLVVELQAHAMASDLSGVQHVTSQIAKLAERYPGWQLYVWLGHGQLEMLRGDLAAAKPLLERALTACMPDRDDPERSISAWPSVAGALVRTLVGLGSSARAQALAERTLEEAARLDVRTTDDVERGLALAETKLGDYPSARARLTALIERQTQLGVRGLHLGASYEARARIAIWAGDAEGLAQYGKLTAQEYRHGYGSGLGGRYERLLEEAQRAGMGAPESLQPPEPSALDQSGERSSVLATVHSAMSSATTTQQRVDSALKLICQELAAEGGHLFLVRPDGDLTWAVSHATEQPGPAELTRAREYFEQALGRNLGDTVVPGARDDVKTTVARGARWTNPQGVPEQALLLTAASERAARHVAVVLLIASSTAEPRPRSADMLAVLGDCLLEAGDTAGIAATG